MHRELNALKKTHVPWMYQVSKCAPQEALCNLDAAFNHFFRRCALKKQGKWKGKLGYPQFKTKKKGLGSFRLTGSIVVSAEGDRAASPGTAAAQRTWVSADQWGPDPLGHSQ